MGLREELEEEIGEAMQRIPLVMQVNVYGPDEGGGPLQATQDVLNALIEIDRVLINAIGRLADEIDALK